MALLENTNIASWGEGIGDVWAPQEDIATESREAPRPAWQECIDSMLEVLSDGSAYSQGDIEPPDRDAIKAALHWLAYLQRKSPASAPSLITAEPSGGILIEWRGDSVVWELSLRNNGTAESTLYRDGRIILLVDAPFFPPQVAN